MTVPEAVAGVERRKPPRGLHGASAAVASRVAVRAIGLVLLVAVARRESTAFFAGYNYLLVLSATLGTVTDAGVAAIAGREVARGAASVADAYRGAAPLQALTTGLAAGLVLLLGALVPGPTHDFRAVLWTTVLTLVTGLLNYQSELLRASGRPWVEAWLQVVAAGLQLALGLWVLAEHGSLAALIAVIALKQGVVVVLGQFWLPAPWRGRPVPDLRRMLLRRGLWLGLASTCTAVVYRLAQLTLGNVGSTRAVADFAIASRFVELSLTFCQTLGFGLLPWLSSRAALNRGLSREAVRVLGVVFVAAVAGTVPLLFVAPAITRGLFGQSYGEAGLAIRVSLAVTPVILVLYLASTTLVADRRERTVFLASAAGLVVAVLGGAVVLLVPTAEAAAVSTDASIVVIAACLLVGLWRNGKTAPVRAR